MQNILLLTKKIKLTYLHGNTDINGKMGYKCVLNKLYHQCNNQLFNNSAASRTKILSLFRVDTSFRITLLIYTKKIRKV